MNATEMLQEIGDRLGSTATVRSVFGEPIHANGRTIVPVAKVAYAFGGGFGSGKRGGSDRQGEGGGGGGGVRAFPAGVLEITDDTTRFVPFMDPKRLAVVFATGAMLGTLIGVRVVRGVRERWARRVTGNRDSAAAADTSADPMSRLP